MRMVVRKDVLKKLMVERDRLKALAMKQDKAERLAKKFKLERMKLQKEVRILKAQTSKSLIARAKRLAKSGETKQFKGKTKANLRKGQKVLSRAFKRFQKFADSLPD